MKVVEDDLELVVVLEVDDVEGAVGLELVPPGLLGDEYTT
jgi:hypothetical protein